MDCKTSNLHEAPVCSHVTSPCAVQAKLVDFSRVAVSSPVVDVSYFLYSSVHPLLISEHYVALLQVLHPSHHNMTPIHE